MSEINWDFLQNHSLHYLEMAFRTDRLERLSNPDGYGKKTGDCGDTVEFFLVTSGDRIQNATIQTSGCVDTVACANAVAHLADGKTLDEAWGITPEAVEEYLETLPPAKKHCAELALGAFYLALASVGEVKRNPWKKFYQTH